MNDKEVLEKVFPKHQLDPYVELLNDGFKIIGDVDHAIRRYKRELRMGLEPADAFEAITEESWGFSGVFSQTVTVESVSE